MIFVGITGKIGSGKSYVTNLFLENSNCFVIDCDKLARHLIENSLEILEKIRLTFGDKTVVDGVLNRKQLRKIVFNDKNQLEKLNCITHPALLEALKNELVKIRELDYEIILVEAAVMFEAGLFTLMDKVIWVESSIDNVLKRVKKRDKTKENTIKNIFNNQTSSQDFSKNIDHIIINNSTKKKLEKDVLKILKNFK